MRCRLGADCHCPPGTEYDVNDDADECPELEMTAQEAQNMVAGVAFLGLLYELVKPRPPRPRR
jgi:hypothetical protein